MTEWKRVEAGHYTRDVSATGRYVARKYRGPWGNRWSLTYEGGHSQTVGDYFPTLREIKDYVRGR